MSEHVWKPGDRAIVEIVEVSKPGEFPAVRLKSAWGYQWVCADVLTPAPDRPADLS